MAKHFVINGGNKLEGEVEIRGSKNAAAAIIASVLLTKEECVISNLPLVEDIKNMIEVLKDMGAEIEWIGEREIKIKAVDSIDPSKIDFEKFSKTRTSVLFIGALLPRFKQFKISRPGGDKIGLRPITTHLDALKELGVDIQIENGYYYFKADKLVGKKIVLPEFSVTATENLIMASSLAEGKTILETVAVEPHVQDLIKMLNSMGAKIKWISSHSLEIEGVKELKGTEHQVTGDYIEAGTFLIAGIVTGGKVKVKNINPNDLSMFIATLIQMGINNVRVGESDIEVEAGEPLVPCRIQALPHPGFPTDLLPLMVPLLTQVKGKSLIHDPLYENRLQYVQELRKMGADIEIVDPHRAFVLGPSQLHGVSIESWDIRAGASLIVAGLIAKGTTTINSIYQIDRGYEKIEERLQSLGADIRRV